MKTASCIWQSTSWTDTGPQRKNNEDAYIDRADLGLWGVADGMGGHEFGDYASSLIENRLNGLQLSHYLGQAKNVVMGAVLACNNDLRQYAMEKEKKTVGSTLVVLIVRGSYACVIWAGDSRLYRLRGNKLRQISRDHSHVFELLARGNITQEEADSHPHANIITRAVGADEQLKLDSLSFEVKDGDRFLLCSDGLTAVLSNGQLNATLQAGCDAKQLVDKALELKTPDNVTAVLVDSVSTGA